MKNENKLFIRASELSELGDLKGAFRLYKQSAKLGNSSSQNNLAVCYENGKGVKSSFEKAIFWYKEAFKNGETIALSNLAGLYLKMGECGLAEYWYIKSIESGDGDALVDLAKLYLSSSYPTEYAKNAMSFLEKALNEKGDNGSVRLIVVKRNQS